MQKIVKWFAPVIALGVAVFLIFFFLSINSDRKIENVEPLTHKSDVSQKKQEMLWLEHFSKTERLGYFYPVNEVYIQVNLDEKIYEQKMYRLSATLLDPYQLFCLKEELKQHKLKYYLKRDTKGVELLIYSKDIAMLHSLVQVLHNYKISAKIMPYKEDV